MADIPSSIRAPSSIRIKLIKPQHKAESESRHPLTRSLGTKKKHMITVGWTRLTTTELTALETWFDENMGVAFDWTEPESTTAYNVVLWEDEMDCEWMPPGRWKVSITMMER